MTIPRSSGDDIHIKIAEPDDPNPPDVTVEMIPNPAEPTKRIIIHSEALIGPGIVLKPVEIMVPKIHAEQVLVAGLLASQYLTTAGQPASIDSQHVYNALATIGGITSVHELLTWVLDAIQNPHDPQVWLEAWAVVLVLGAILVGLKWTKP